MAGDSSSGGIVGADRFAGWPQARARALLLAVVLLLGLSAWVPLTVGRGEVAKPPALAGPGAAAKARPRDEDLKLYDIAIARIRRGENYYAFIAEEHRKAHYPLRPGVAVRLPTLAYIDAALGVSGEGSAPLASGAAIALMLGVLWAWWGRLDFELRGFEPRQAGRLRRMAMALLFLGASLGLNRYYFVLHELWAGMLVALAIGLHRPEGRGGRWLAAWLAAALALAIREHVAPFVLLLAAFAAWRRAWPEMAAWLGLLVLFAFGLAMHLQLIAAVTLPGDPVGPSWLAMRGLGGWLSDVVLSSNLRFLPHWAAGPLVMLMVLGFAGWRSGLGAFLTLLYLGYGLLFMIAGRDDNFYWGAVIAPGMFAGLAFAPMALASLVRRSAA